jgi:hypothetical protein
MWPRIWGIPYNSWVPKIAL